MTTAAAEHVSPEAMRDGLLAQLYANRSELRGIALVQALKALAALVPPPPPEPTGDDRPFSILEQLDALPKGEARKLLRQRITQLREEVAELEAALVATADE